ncbi:ferritin Dps family protein [Sulfurifustis variabilis]|uniref:Ferritin Dps family protein n=1 Tax=Sulfurifustis variabilis TaxID=1675686 RepID=A0A1B4V6P6_9GAMM|nr:ferritin-like domain-containing protein [Sulfurifustis variabilis]BAU49206.1 ferritin Dps family protein [Sulfurifustis variabilis]
MEKTGSEMGMNKTGVQMSPKDIERMLKNVEESGAEAGDGSGIAAVRTSYITEAEPVGTVPMPGTVKGAAKAGVKKLTGKSPEVFLDMLGERLAFERGGVRLYESMLTKCQATPEKIPGMSTEQLTHFRDEEAKHFRWVAEALESLGADPTAQTPGADVTGIESMGIMQVMDDPRTTLSQSLHALLVAELADHDGWELLIKLADDMGQDEMAKNFRQALKEEGEHLSHVRAWHEQSVRSELK